MNRSLKRALEASPEGRAYLAATKKAKADKRKRSSKAGSERARASKEERRAKLAEIRDAVFARAAGKCEFCCGVPPGEPLHLHHILSGGMRRAKESVETCAGVCRWCHDDYHRNAPRALDDALNWATWLGYAEARRAIERRIAKVQAARASAESRRSGESGAGGDAK